MVTPKPFGESIYPDDLSLWLYLMGRKYYSDGPPTFVLAVYSLYDQRAPEQTTPKNPRLLRYAG